MLLLNVFTQRNVVEDFFDRSWILLATQQNRVLCHPLGDLGVTYTVHRVVDFLLVLIELFSTALTVEAVWANIGRNCDFWKGWAQISGGMGSSTKGTNDSWRHKTRVPGLSRGVVCVILRLAVLIQYRRVTDPQIDWHTDTTTVNTRAGKASRG